MIRFAFDLRASQAKAEDDPKPALLAQVIHASLPRPLQAESNRREGGVSGRIPLAQLQIVPRFQARVLVRLRPSVLDPAGEAARAAASRLDVEGLASLRIGKAVEIELDAPDEAEARRRIERLSDRLLANPVIEDWSLEIQSS